MTSIWSGRPSNKEHELGAKAEVPGEVFLALFEQNITSNGPQLIGISL